MKRDGIVFSMVFFFLIGCLVSMAPPVQADEYPSQDIRMIIGGKPGGGFDTYARAISRYMKKYLPKGVNIIVENHPGAGHKIAAAMMYNAEPDGYTIGMPMMPGLYLPQMFEDQKYDMTKATWLVTILKDPQVLAVTPKSGFKTLDDLKKADVVRVPIVGFSSETGVILQNENLGIKAKYISGHKNSKESVLAALRGDGDMVGFTFGSLRKFLAKKQLLPIVVSGSEKRIPAIPDTPTLAEVGLPDLNGILGTYRVLAGPPNMPPAVTKYLRDSLYKTLTDPEFVEWSKKVKRPVEVLNGEDTEKELMNVMNSYAKYKEDVRKYLKQK